MKKHGAPVSAPVVAKPTSTGRRATLTYPNKARHRNMPGFALRVIPRWLSALKSVFARFAYIYCTAKRGEKSNYADNESGKVFCCRQNPAYCRQIQNKKGR